MLRTLMAALAVTLLSTAAMAGNCTTDTPVNAAIAEKAFNDVANPPTYDFSGTAHLAGTATCPDNTGDLLALSAALSTPVWLEAGERFAVSGGLGFSGDGDTAVGATGVMRFDRNFSGFAGAAVGTENTDNWAGKVGVRAGF